MTRWAASRTVTISLLAGFLSPPDLLFSSTSAPPSLRASCFSRRCCWAEAKNSYSGVISLCRRRRREKGKLPLFELPPNLSQPQQITKPITAIIIDQCRPNSTSRTRSSATRRPSRCTRSQVSFRCQVRSCVSATSLFISRGGPAQTSVVADATSKAIDGEPDSLLPSLCLSQIQLTAAAPDEQPQQSTQTHERPITNMPIRPKHEKQSKR